jgi:hypothetical protein
VVDIIQFRIRLLQGKQVIHRLADIMVIPWTAKELPDEEALSR